MIKINKININNKDYTNYATYSIQGKNTLDESLDIIYLELKGIKQENPFTPFDDVIVEFEDNTRKITKEMQIESDSTAENIQAKTYNHNIMITEQTKWFERLFVEKSIRQPLIHDYYGGRSSVTPDVSPSIYTEQYKTPYESPSLAGTEFNVLSCENVLALNYAGASSTLVVYKDGVNISGVLPYNQGFTTTLENGTYEIRYNIYIVSEFGEIGQTTATYIIDAIDKVEPKEDYTIRDVINQLLATCIIRRKSEQPLFTLAEANDYEESDKYKEKVEESLNETSPEFTFNKMSLWEALKTVGDYIHAVPRLNGKKVYFDLLGRMEYAKKLDNYVSSTSNTSSNNFCNALDSKVANLTNMDDIAQGSVTTPDNSGYRTLRVESGNAIITDTGVIIPTENNIEEVEKLEIGYLSDGTLVGDITPFVYSSDEYNNLSSYSDRYPNAKMYAIYYTKGSKDIKGLTFKRENVISSAFENIAIKNIIFKKTNKPRNWWTSFWDNEDVTKLQYRLTYIPSTDTKVTQYKANKEDLSNKPLYIAYNQSASKVSSNAYGENLKGTIAKIGNIEKTKMYILPTLDLIPKCGTLFDKDYYISVVKYEIYPQFIKCELGLSKNYNNKSAYVEINSQLQFFEYNRDIAIDRYVVYEDFCEVGNDSEPGDSLITNDGITKFANAFESGYSGTPIACVKSQGYTENGGELKEVVLPVISLGVGNSILLAYKYEDTVSAGNSVQTVSTVGNPDRRYQNYVKYTDIYGEVDNLAVKFGISTSTPSGYEESVTRGDDIPNTTNFGDMEIYFDTQNDNIDLKKGVGEIPHISYQLHFISNNNNLIIGSGLTRKSTFTTSEECQYKLYLLPNRINKFDTKINLTNSQFYDTISINKDFVNKKIKIEDFTVPSGNYKAWAIVQTYNDQNDLIIGENIDIKSGDIVKMPVFTFKHKIKGE